MAAPRQYRHNRQTLNVAADFPPWFVDYLEPKWFKCVYGGRSASKTRTVAQWFICKALEGGMRAVCTREYEKSTSKSVKPALEWAISKLHVKDYFDVQVNKIICLANDSVITFEGIESDPEGNKGWENQTHAWFEESDRLSKHAADVILPTLMRGESETECWFTFNPNMRTDWVWQRFVEEYNEETDIVKKITWLDNPWHTAQAEAERQRMLRENPLDHRQHWEGFPNDGLAEEHVLSRDMVDACVKAYILLDEEEQWVLDLDANKHCGYDVADAGKDRNAYAYRYGPVIEGIDSWFSKTSGYFKPSAERAMSNAVRDGATNLYYDSIGVGSCMKGEFYRLDPPFRVEGVSFGGAVAGKSRQFTYKMSNEDYFNKRNAQLAWAVRLRAQKTLRLLNGDRDVDPEECLFINNKIPNLSKYLYDLTVPMWHRNPVNKKIQIDKRAGRNESPDLYDATVLAFSRDSRSGLRGR